MTQKLTSLQEAFITEFLVDFNATAAAFRAGYQGSRATLAAIGCENLDNPPIRQRINQALEEWAMPAKEVLLRLSRHARGSMADLISETPTGEVEVDLAKAHRLGAMDHVKYLAHDQRWKNDILVRNRFEISLHDSLAALTLLARAYDIPAGLLAEIALIPSDDSDELTEDPQEYVKQVLLAVKRTMEWEQQEYAGIDLSTIWP
jgi:hypothetical protein